MNLKIILIFLIILIKISISSKKNFGFTDRQLSINYMGPCLGVKNLTFEFKCDMTRPNRTTYLINAEFNVNFDVDPYFKGYRGKNKQN